MLKRLRPSFLIILGLLLLPLLLYFPVTLGGRTMLPADNFFGFPPWKSFAGQFGVTVPHNQLLSDLILENYPWKRFIVQAIQRRELPLWNPHQFAGIPFLADGQHSAMYPFSVLFYLMPLWRAYGWFTVSQHFLAGLCAYIFLRVLKLPRPAAALGAVVYELSLFMVVSAVFPMILAGAAWLPLLLACIELIVDQRPLFGGRPATLPWAVIGGLAFGAQILAGHAEVIYYSGLIMGAYAGYRLLGQWVNGVIGQRVTWTASQPITHRPLHVALLRVAPLRAAVYLLLMVVLGAGVGAVQLAPLVDLVRYNFRTNSASFEQVMGWAYPPRHVLAFLIPDVFGNPAHHAYFDLFLWRWVPATMNAMGEASHTIDWGLKNYVEGGAYVGLLPWLLAVIGIVAWIFVMLQKRRRKEAGRKIPSSSFLLPPSYPVPFFAVLALLSLLFAFGSRAYALIFWLPGIDQLHSPFRWVWPLSLCVAVLAGYGMAALGQARGMKLEEGRRAISSFLLPPSSFPTSAARLLAWLCILGGVAVLFALVVARLAYDRIEGLVERIFTSLALAPNAFAAGRMFFSYEAGQIAIFALLLTAAGVVLWFAGRPPHPLTPSPARRGGQRVRWQYLAFAVVAFDLLVAGYGFNSAADPGILSFTPPAVEFLKTDTSLWRFTTFAPGGRKVMLANTGWLFDFHDNRGYGSIIPKQYADYMRAVEPQDDLDYNQIGPIYEPASLDSPLLDLLNVKYVLSAVPIQSPKYRLVYSGEVLIYENLAVVPRAFTLPLTAARYSNEPLADLRVFDPRQFLLLDDPAAPVSSDPAASSPAPARVEAYGSNGVTLSAQVTDPSYLILADSYYEGWNAYLSPRPPPRIEGGEPAVRLIEEEQIPIYRADGNFRAVHLMPGAWQIRFEYSPFWVKFGAFATGISLLTLIFLLGAWLWRHFYRESTLDSTARRVAKNSLAPMALNLMNRGIDLVFAAFYLRLLGPGDAGEYSFAIVIVGWFEIWTNFGLNSLLTREVARSPENASRYLSNTTFFRLALGAVTFPLLVGMLLLLQGTAGLRSDTFLAIALLAIGMAPASVSTGLSALFYAFEKAEYPAAIATIATVLKVFFGAMVLLLGAGFVGLAGVSILTNTVTMITLGALAWRLFFRPRFQVDWKLQRGMVGESFPLMLNHLLATLFFKVDVPLLHTIRGEREVGWYTTAYKFLDAFNIIPSFFTLALFPVMSRQASEDRPALMRSYALAVKLLVGVSLPLAVVTTALSRNLIGLLAGQEFLPQSAIALSLIVWSIPIGWTNSVTNYLLIALDQQRDLTRAFVLALAFNLIANLIFVPRYGFPAAAIITIFSELFEGMAFYRYLRRGLGPVPWGRLLWRLALAGSGMVIVALLLWPVNPVAALAVGLVVYAGGVLGLRAFDEGELALLRSVLPARI